MGTESLRLCLILILTLTIVPLVDPARPVFPLYGLFTHRQSSSIQLAIEQINEYFDFRFNQSQATTHCDVGTGVKTFFDMLNRSSSSVKILFTDVCQNVLSYISEIATYLRLSVISFTDSDLSLLGNDRYRYFYHIVPSDHAHNRVRKALLEYFNWTRFGLIYQHGSKYTLVANDFSNLIGLDKKQFEVNLTRGVAYRYGSEWYDDNAKYIKTLLKDFKSRDIRIIIANFNQTIATQMFCHAANENVYGYRYQWIILGYPSTAAWWEERTDCSVQQLIRAINGTLQTRVSRLSMDENEDRSMFLEEYLRQFQEIDEDYFDTYAYDTIWALAHFYDQQQQQGFVNQSDVETFKKSIDTLDFLGATGRVRFLNGGRIGEVLVEQYVACRMMKNGTCLPPCYEEEDDCNLTVVKIFLGKHSESKTDPPLLYPLNPIIWHGHGPPRDRTNQTIQFEHIYLSVFISISLCSGFGLIVSCAFLAFNVHFRMHRYIRMSSPSLNNIILGGCMCAYLSIILMGLNSSLFSQRYPVEFLMNIICPIRVWILCLSFTLAFGSMFGKTWRVHSIFTNIHMTKKGIHDSRLLAMVGLLLLIDLIFLISWQIFDPIHRQLVYDVPYRLKFNQDIEIQPFREECRSYNMSLWFVVLILYKGLLMFYGLFLSWKTRHVTIPALNDSRYIGLSVYVVFICSTLGSLVIFIPSEQIQLSYFLSSFFIVTCTTATVCLVFVPKIIEVHRDPYSRKRQPRVTARLQTKLTQSILLTNQDLQAAISDNEELKLVLAMQERTLNTLLSQLDDVSMGKICTDEIEPFEFERLIVTDDEDDEEEVDLRLSKYPSSTGRVVRAVSLCLLSKNNIGQLYWPEGAVLTRYSIPQHIQRYPRHNRWRGENRTDTSFDRYHRSLSSHIEHLFDGLSSLNPTRLEEMKETDLVSSFNG